MHAAARRLSTLARHALDALLGLVQWLPGAALALVLLFATGVVVWTGHPASVGQALTMAKPWVPTLDGLKWSGLNATLRNGGQAERITWSQNGLTVVAEQAQLQWQWQPLLRGDKLVLKLAAEHIRVTDQSPASTAPLQAPAHLRLPLAVDLQLDVAHLSLEGPTPLHTGRLLATHQYATGANAHHQLHIASWVLPQGSVALDLTVQANAPMTLSANLNGEVKGTLPGGTTRPRETKTARAAASTAPRAWHAVGQAQANGQLAGPDAQVSVTAQLAPTQGGATGPHLQAQATVRPWASQPLHALQATLKQLDVAAFWPSWPHTQVSGNANALPTADNLWQVDLNLVNSASGPWDTGQLPLQAINLKGLASAQQVKVTHLRAEVGQGLVTAQGQWQASPAQWQGKLTATQLQTRFLHTQWPAAEVAGAATATGDGKGQTTFQLDAQAVPLGTTATKPVKNGQKISSKEVISIKRKWQISSQGSWNGSQLTLAQVSLQADGASLNAQGQVTPGGPAFSGQAKLVAPGLQADLNGAWGPDAGEGSAHLKLQNGGQLHTWLAGLPLVGNHVANGTARGTADLQATWRGGWAQPDTRINAQLTQGDLAWQTTADSPLWSAQGLTAQIQGTPAALDVSTSGQLRWNQWQAQLSAAGTASNLTATAGQLTLGRLQLALTPGPGMTPVAAHAPAPLQVQWAHGGWALSAGEFQLSPEPGAPPTQLRWQRTSQQAGVLATEGELNQVGMRWANLLLNLAASASAPPARPATARDHLAEAGLSGNLTLQGRWQLRWPVGNTPPGNAESPPQVQLSLQRQSGDLTVASADLSSGNGPGVRGPAVNMGVRQAAVTVRTTGTALDATLDWDSAQAGQVQARMGAPLTPPRTAPGSTAATGPHWGLDSTAPLRGQLTASLPQIGVWAALAPPGWRTRGSLDLNATLTGTVGQPDWQGTLQGRDLALRSVVEGLEFGNGRLRATLGGERMDITEFTLEGAGGPTAGGTLSATGSAQWARQTATATPAPRLNLNATAHKLRVSARADRRLTLSGNLAATLEGGMLKLRGDLNADQAQFVLPDETAPSLGTDVVVRLGSKTTDAIPPVAPLGTDVLVNVGLGNQFDVRGQGLQTRLSGKLVVSSAPESTTFQVRGEVRAASGTYRAYGQQLRIEEGVLRFSGPYDDPALDILALRGASAPSRAISGSGTDNQLVGVKITGSARNPVVKLYANPEMPDSDKLAWLVLGRPASGAGAEAAVLQQAALALLSGSSGMDATLASKLGLDDISFRGNSTLANGTTQDAAVSLGKRLSSKLYVAYEHSLSSAVGAISLYYDVSRRLTIRAQAGQDNALDLIFTVTHD